MSRGEFEEWLGYFLKMDKLLQVRFLFVGFQNRIQNNIYAKRYHPKSLVDKAHHS